MDGLISKKNKLGMQRVIQKESWKMMRPGIPIHKIIWVVLHQVFTVLVGSI